MAVKGLINYPTSNITFALAFSSILGGFGGPMLKSLPSSGNAGDVNDMANKSRLEAMRDGIISELKKLKINSPKTRVGVVYFNDDVSLNLLDFCFLFFYLMHS